ncbi:MAG: class B sortase [Eubacteriaceae bacterium]
MVRMMVRTFSVVLIMGSITVMGVYFYQIYNNNKIYKEIRNEVELEQREDESEETMTEEERLSLKHAYLSNINKDTVGWIHVPDTVIDYPVVMGENNRYYLNKDFKKNIANAGAIFMDYRNQDTIKDKHIIIYGHHMKDGSMFKELVEYKNKDFFENSKIIMFETPESITQWEVFSVYVTDVGFNYIETNFNTDAQFLSFIKTIQKKSKFNSKIILDATDRILTLSTCTYEMKNARFVVHARQIDNATK